MARQIDETLAVFQRLGSPEEIRALADQGYGLAGPSPANTHIHLPPNFSAFESVQQAVDQAAQEGIVLLGANNFYDCALFGDFAERARTRGIFPSFGLEVIAMQDDSRDAGVRLNDPDNPGRTYLCGKGITRFGQMTEAAERLLDEIRCRDRARMQSMIALLRTTFAERGLQTEIDETAVVDLVVARHGVPRESVFLQERHVAQAFQEMLCRVVPADDRLARLDAILNAKTSASGPDDCIAIQNDIRSHLMKAGQPAFAVETFLCLQDATRLVLKLGGIPSYPTLLDGSSLTNSFEADVDTMIAMLQSQRIHAVEWILPRNSIAMVRKYATKIRAAGLVATAGTEHNTLEQLPITPACCDGPVPEDLQAIFWEGACLVAAHQFLTLHGRCGYVDSAGNPNPEYRSADERIRSLARIGAAVIGRYRENSSAKR